MVKKVFAGGRFSFTKFKTLLTHKEKNCSLVECYPETGRSHQLRVHLDHSGLPIVGDKRYGHRNRKAIEDELLQLASVHHLLHAKTLKFIPYRRQKPVTVEAPLPENFAKFLEIISSEKVH